MKAYTKAYNCLKTDNSLKGFMKLKQAMWMIFLVMALSSLPLVNAQNTASVAATVNGKNVLVKEVDAMVKAAQASGTKDSPELRNAILNDLVVREAILQDVKKNALEKRGDNEARVKMATQNILIDLWFVEFLKTHPILEEELKTEYDRQAGLTKEGKNSNEYKISQIVLTTELAAKEVINQLNVGGSFSQLAREKSIDKQSGALGGEISTWALPDQLVPPLGDTVLALAKGGVAANAVKTNLGWHVVRLDDSRKFKLPTFDEAKSILSQSVLNRRKQEAIAGLMKKTTVAPGK